jgi:hypothetical protein
MGIVTGRRINSSEGEDGAMSRQNPLGNALGVRDDGRTDRRNTRCQVTWWPSQSRLRMALPKSCLQRLVTGLVDSGQTTSEGHATHGVADQAPVGTQTRSCPEKQEHNLPSQTPGPAINGIEWVEG